MATLCFEVHMKKDFESWKKIFDEHAPERAKTCDESKTTVGKVSDKLAVVMVYNVDMEKMGAMVEDPEFKKMVEPLVEKHVIYTCAPLGPPPS